MPHRLRLGPTASFALLVSIVLAFLSASTAPTPLYAVYQREWGFSPITTTVVFAAYAIAVLVSLLIVGRVSDHIGRRPMLFAALALQIVAMVVFTSAGSVGALLTARIVQGVATGSAVGAIGAGMLDLDRTRGALANSFAPVLGTSLGALMSGLAVQYLSWPTHLIYVVLICVFVLQGLALTRMPETVTRKPGALASLRPDVKLPRPARGPFAVVAPVIFAVWALAGFYGALAPALTGVLVGSHDAVYGGLGLTTLAGAGAIAVLLLRKAPARTVMLVGVPALVVGVAVVLVSVGDGGGGAASVSGFFVGTALAGIGFGAGFQVGIRLVVPVVEAHERGGVLSLLYVVTYLGMGIPAVIGGVLVVHGGGLVTTAREYGVAVIVLALLALAGLLLGGGRLQPAGPRVVIEGSSGRQDRSAGAGRGTAEAGRASHAPVAAAAERRRGDLD
ncbi:MFS transporter [Streptomyces sp. NPDC026672]|uniref:MFS transporter n=1 Tax=Streptomyces sp. NPDC026672 TaxID=3155252 RepID=UPI0033C02DD5